MENQSRLQGWQRNWTTSHLNGVPALLNGEDAETGRATLNAQKPEHVFLCRAAHVPCPTSRVPTAFAGTWLTGERPIALAVGGCIWLASGRRRAGKCCATDRSRPITARPSTVPGRPTAVLAWLEPR
jgi:hypothetical protein